MKKIFFTICTILLAVRSHAGELSCVTVRNQNFEIIKVINDEASLKLFTGIWKTREKLKTSVAPQWLFKIDIEGKGYGDRWLYDPRGYVHVLSKLKVPIYKIPARSIQTIDWYS